MKKILKLGVFTISLLSLVIIRSGAYYSDAEESYDNCFVFEEPEPPLELHLMISEVYYDHPGIQQEKYKEWIELYNATSSPININNWDIRDNDDTINLPNATIPAYSYAVLLRNSNDYTFPGGIQKIYLSSWFDTDLSNSGDRLRLRDVGNNVIDTMSYGNDTTYFNPAAPDVSSGHSLERTSVVVDTDTAADWVDQDTPTPGGPYAP